ncbi:uncharacterized protein LAESUDRAFT_176139 [Laetiporus sulphureus 93-53]|uniref:Pentacotripeptide-repeat region of PRORP domain-containing protein n=1 Tax=Laetiporus sulphureus 93-53 TaxID=1314785 RepID=A0A165E7M2_9APHY|nr:uncharacterized protein LAESUDRAFT_176139 [Laetiporus sulphureus 93-53]KZT06395.1 hypothetical protein LAESUDRAFT_176139 [Laetiporus sulphureus 93-53]
MLEPLAATVFNTLLSGRPFTALPHSTTSQLALRMTAGAAASAFPSDFFTPRPRRVKGKERAMPLDDCLCDDIPVRLESCTDIKYIVALHGTVMSRPRVRRLSCRKIMHAPTRSTLPSLHNLARRVDLSQIRYVSSLQEPPDSSASEPGTQHLDQWRSMIMDYTSGARASDPEKVWRAYESLQQADGCASMTANQLLSYGARVAAIVEDGHFDWIQIESFILWGTRLLSLLQNVSDRIKTVSHDKDFLLWRILGVCGLAMVGKIDDAVAAAHDVQEMPFQPEGRIQVLQMHDVLICSLRQHRDPVAVLEYLVEKWEAVGTYLHRSTLRWQNKGHPQIKAFRMHAFQSVACIQSPVGFLQDVHEQWSQDRRQVAGEFLVHALCECKMGKEALDVLEIMRNQSLSFTVELQLEVVKALVKADAFELANSLFMSLTQFMGSGQMFVTFQTVGLYLFSHQGDIPRSEEYFNRLSQRSAVNITHIAMMLHAHAVNGNAKLAVQLFEHFFPPAISRRPDALRPNIYHYTAVIHAFAREGSLESMNHWLEVMTKDGIYPDSYVYSIILKSFAEKGETSYVANLLDQMRAAGMSPSREHYSTIIALLAKRRDVIAAEEIYKRAVSEGVVPDRQLVTAMMNAYVEAGQWEGVIRAFDYLKSSAHRGLRLSVEVYNTLLKAYVLIGAPFRVVANLFRRLDEARVRPDAHTFALLILSACDSGLMEIAFDLYKEMEALSEDWQSHMHINVYVLTIIMAGYLRKGDRGKARKLFDEMRKQGIQPSAITYAAIVKAYGKEQSGAGLQVAEEFVQSLMSAEKTHEWAKTSGNRARAIETVFAPLLSAYARREHPEDVERLISQMLEAGGEPTIGALTAMLDAHRRKGNADAAREIWPQIVELGLRHSEVDSLFAPVSAKGGALPDLRGHGMAMCIPLSIYTDAMSAGGYHAEVAEAWRRLHEEKLAFDSHNYNHLIVALVRAGEPERAFDIVESVILPYQRRFRESLSMKREFEPKSPLRAERLPQPDDLPDVSPHAPMHSTDRRETAVGTATLKSSRSMEEEFQEDFAHALQILYKFSPLWNVWRPHAVVLNLLHEVLDHLESGRLIQPVRPATASPEPTPDPQTIGQRRLKAAAILRKIYSECPQTVEMARDFNSVRRARTRKFIGRRSE